MWRNHNQSLGWDLLQFDMTADLCLSFPSFQIPQLTHCLWSTQKNWKVEVAEEIYNKQQMWIYHTWDKYQVCRDSPCSGAALPLLLSAGNNRSENIKRDISWLVSSCGTLHCLGEPKSFIVKVPKGISSCNLKTQKQKWCTIFFLTVFVLQSVFIIHIALQMS